MHAFRYFRGLVVGVALTALSISPLQAQTAPGLDSLLAPHRSAMDALKVLDGVWRGTGWTLLPSGGKWSFSQTIRVGTMGEGAVRVLEGRSYGPQGRLTATNFEIISFNASSKSYSLRVYTEGSIADVAVAPTAGGFTLEYPAGDATVRFTIAVTNGVWSEVAERRTANREPVRFLELVLHRVGDTDWPAAGAVPPG